jgi:hypothetical protein
MGLKEPTDKDIADLVRRLFDDMEHDRRIDTMRRQAGLAYIRREAEKTKTGEQP